METAIINVGKLRRRDDARPLDRSVVKAIAASMRDVGIINPLRVRRTAIFQNGREAEGYEIIAGAHRLEASRDAGINDLPCVIVDDDDLHAELAMIDENLCRAELGAAERSRVTTRRQEVYELIHPEARNGHAGATQRWNASAKLADAFSKETASRTGRSERAVQRDAERGKKISERALSLVAGTSLDTGAYLDKIKTLPPEAQEEHVAESLRQRQSRPVSPAPDPLNEVEAKERWIVQGITWWNKGCAEWREEFRARTDDPPVMDNNNRASSA